MELRQLKHFLAVIETGSLNRAADVANVSQQGLSASIRSLEASLGVTLFERNRTGVQPTVHGLALARHARVIVGQQRLARSELAALSAAEVGTADVGCGQFFARRIMPAAIRRLHRQRPGLNVRVIENGSDVLFKMLLDGELDFVASTPSASFSTHPDLAQEVLFEDRDSVMVRPEHPLARQEGVTLADLTRYTWLFSERFEGDRARVLQLFAQAGIKPPRSMVLTDSATIILELLANDDYVHVSGRSFFRREFSTVEFVALDLPEFITRRVGVITTHRQRMLSPASEALLHHFREAWNELDRLRSEPGRPDDAEG